MLTPLSAQQSPTNSQSLSAGSLLVFVSAFAKGEEGAVWSLRLNLRTGQLEKIRSNDSVSQPFFMALSPDQQRLYCTHAPKSFGSEEPEEVVAFAIENSDGQLRELNRQSTRGTASCYLDVDRAGKTLLVANYTSGDVASLPIAEDGSLKPAASFLRHSGTSVDSKRQQEPHAHCIVVSPDGRHVLAADLGIDKVLNYQLDPATSKLASAEQPFVRTPPGAGPRHLTFHPRGKHVYVIHELANTIGVFSYLPEQGILIERQVISTLPADATVTTHTADVKLTPDGRFAYGTNRGHDSLACYRVAEDGALSLIEIRPSLGKGPQNLAITPDGRWLLCANMPGNNVVVFAIDGESGRLREVGEPLAIPMPSCIMLRTKQ
ncbi:MAG: lactonase family protein [Planctomycetales bacterium]|nr:lactonase family protein [Planctomycetales bacterium]